MLERTRQYLLSRRDGRGGFLRNPKALGSFGCAPDHITNAYIVWALTESGENDDLNRELHALTEQAQTSTDPYFLALVANSLLNRGRGDDARPILVKLAAAQQADGRLDAAQTSITGSGGRDLQIETTALTLLAWLKANRVDYHDNIRRAVTWISRQRGGHGGFGSTQATILALKALSMHIRENKKTAEAGELIVTVNGREAGRLAFPAGVQDALVLDVPGAEQFLRPGPNDVRVQITGNNVFPHTLSWSYQTLKPANAEGCPVRLETRLDKAAADAEETVRLTVRLQNTSGKGQGMAVAIIGLPAGVALPEDMKQLKDLARPEGDKPGTIAAWETNGRELILYWRDLAPDADIQLNLTLHCRIPGEYTGPASRAYLYYNADHKFWCDPLQMTIRAK